MSWFAGWFGEQIKYVEASMDAFLVGSTATLASALPSGTISLVLVEPVGVVPVIDTQNYLAVEVTVEGELSVEVVTT